MRRCLQTKDTDAPTHFRLSKIKQQDLLLLKECAAGLQVGPDIGAGKPRSKQEVWLPSPLPGRSKSGLKAGF